MSICVRNLRANDAVDLFDVAVFGVSMMSCDKMASRRRHCAELDARASPVDPQKIVTHRLTQYPVKHPDF